MGIAGGLIIEIKEVNMCKCAPQYPAKEKKKKKEEKKRKRKRVEQHIMLGKHICQARSEGRMHLDTSFFET